MRKLDNSLKERAAAPLSVEIKLEWDHAIRDLQDRMLGPLWAGHVAIEVNPTSNITLGPFDKMVESPMFRWHLPVEDPTPFPPVVVLGSDDPANFRTEVLQEYAVLSCAAECRGATPRQIDTWLRALREAGLQYRFRAVVPG